MMKKKINREEFLRLVYESCKSILKEGKEEKPQEQEQSSSAGPILFQPSFYQGKYYFNIEIKDKSKFGALSNFSTTMANNAQHNAAERNIQFTKNDFDKVKKTYRIASDNKQLDDTTKCLILSVPITHPEKLMDKDGKPSSDSQDVRRIWNVLVFLKKNANINIDGNDVKNAFETMFYYFSNKPTKENEEQVEIEINKLFFKICQTLGDKKTKQLLSTIQVSDKGYIADHQYSLRNKLRIIAQATIYDQNGGNQVNTISYLATPRQWREMGRRVIDFSHPYYTVTFNGGKGSQEDEIKFAKSRGLQPIRMNENNRNGVGFNTGRGLNAAVNAQMYGRKSFSYNDAVYDVQATETINGFQDKFSEEPGMKNNLTGELNDIAKQKIGVSSDTSNQTEKDDRTKQLNDMFGTTNYEGVNLTYQATCMAAGVTPNISNNGDINAMIKESGSLIEKMLIKKLQGTKDCEGRIARTENYLPLIPVGRILIQASIGLPMDDAPEIEWAEEHQQVTNALSPHVFSISNKILNNKKELMNIKSGDITEMISLFSPMLVFEETFNNALKLIEEYAKK